MNCVDRIANAILYEGYILYPYRRSAVKNQQRWNFGVLYPRAYAAAQTGSDASSFQTECLAVASAAAELTVRTRFLQMVQRQVGIPGPDKTPNYEAVDSLDVGGRMFQSWQEASEREVEMRFALDAGAETTVKFDLPSADLIEELFEDGQVRGVIVRSQESIRVEVAVSVERETDSLARIRVVVSNAVDADDAALPNRDRALMQSMLSAHATLTLDGGEFISLIDPPEHFRAIAAGCQNIGCWPVLVGDEGQRDTMLASPIILYDYPQVAEQSAGDLFDGTEIDEILSLRILALTDEEKREMAAADESARKMLKRTEALSADEFMRMHGVMRR